MSEYTLDFIEAVKALDEGRCEKIENEVGRRLEALIYSHNKHIIASTIRDFLGKWKLIGVKPRTEERTVKYWLVVWKDGRHGIYWTEPDCETYGRTQQIIPLSYTYTYTFPEED